MKNMGFYEPFWPEGPHRLTTVVFYSVGIRSKTEFLMFIQEK
jgi:hypothetical protein